MSDGHWQLDGSSPELYQRYLVPTITSKWAEDPAEVMMGTFAGGRIALKQRSERLIAASSRRRIEISSADQPDRAGVFAMSA